MHYLQVPWEEAFSEEFYDCYHLVNLPIRDGLTSLDGPTKNAGLRYICDFNPYPGDGNFGQIYDKYILKIHFGIAFRFPDRVKGEL